MSAPNGSEKDPALRAAGFVLFCREGSRVLYLTLRNRKHGDVGFPKGHQHAGESELSTALRETVEETGIRPQPNPWFRRTISYRAFGRLKQVVYLLASCETEEVALSSEHASYAWLDLDGAKQALQHQALRDVLEDAAVFLKDPILRRGLTPIDARALLIEKCGADAPVIGHTEQVAGIARACADAWGDLDVAFVEAAAWLHDLGRASTHGIRHPLEGFRLACAEGYPGYAPPCLSHYVKGRGEAELGIDESLAREMWQACDLATFEPEERLIAMADLMAIGERRGTMEQRLADLERRYGPSPFFDSGHAVGRRLRAEFEARTGQDLYALVLS